MGGRRRREISASLLGASIRLLTNEVALDLKCGRVGVDETKTNDSIGGAGRRRGWDEDARLRALYEYASLGERMMSYQRCEVFGGCDQEGRHVQHEPWKPYAADSRMGSSSKRPSGIEGPRRGKARHRVRQ